MNIITLTLNPAIDVHCHTKTFRPYKENQCTVTQREAGGKGVNISRALTKNGVDNLAFVVLGDQNGEGFRQSLLSDGMQVLSVTVPGMIRENITLHCDDSDETRLSFAGFSVGEDLLAQVEETLGNRIGTDTVVTFTGSNPKGLSMTEVKAFLRRIAENGALTVIDSRSFTLADLVELKPWLIKPNQEEISAYLGREIETFDEVAAAARELHGQGIENVMISLGAKGALLVCAEGLFVATPPKIEALSTIGAGDSSIAGFLAAAQKPAAQRLRTAVAFGTAACLTPGTLPPKKEDVEEIYQKITLQ